jgi:hypothetical protein
MVKICNETDQVFTRCYCCGEFKPATIEYFRKEARPDRDRDFRPLCKKCANEQLREYLKDRKHKEEMEKMEKMKEISKETVYSDPLFNDKNISPMEEKLDKLLAYL